MIPKKIHYVWIGNKEIPKDLKKCIKSWKRNLPDFEFILWNEENFDIASNKFTQQAYKEKKWAYVSDYIRAKVIYEEGGIYLDTDNIVLKNLSPFLKTKAFVGFENENYPFTACFGAIKHHPFVKKMLDYYDDISFSFDVDDQMASVNTKIVSDILVNDYFCKVNNKKQILGDDIAVYPDYVLCNPSKDSYVIHVFTGTWMEGKKPFLRKLIKFLKLRITSQRKAGLYKKLIGRSK